jgi:molybdate/tungstate transport system ATP-binding protein
MIEIKDLSLHVGTFSLKDINLTILDREYFVILGPTGAGKSLLIECIAGLRLIKRGEILVDKRDITRLPPEKRNIGYLPQDYVLFPFLDVRRNIAFGLKQYRLDKTEVYERTEKLCSLLGISSLSSRDVCSLSGGEKQRVAMARALAPSPKILLMDEPLSNVDVQTGKRLRLELKRLTKQLEITVVHVTHNQVEAEEIADRITIMNDGRLEQVGSPEEIFFYPENEMVSDFIGGPNILDCQTYYPLGNGLAEVESGGLRVVLAHAGSPVKRIALFPRDIYVSETQPPGPAQVNRFHGTISKVTRYGGLIRLHINIGSSTLQAELPEDSLESMNLTVGKEVHVILKLRRIKVLDGTDQSS